jgi:hypothetical protein
MISEQLKVSADEAFARLRAHAFAAERELDEMANDIVARRLRFDELDGPRSRDVGDGSATR